MNPWLLIFAWLASGAGLPAPQASRPRTLYGLNLSPPDAPIVVSASPGQIVFQASDPDSPPAAVPATLNWTTDSKNKRWWSVTAQASPSTGCPTVPVSAVTVSCSSIVIDGVTYACNASFPLGGAPQYLGQMRQVKGRDVAYSVNLLFTLADSWKYIAQTDTPCSTSVTYTVTFD